MGVFCVFFALLVVGLAEGQQFGGPEDGWRDPGRWGPGRPGRPGDWRNGGWDGNDDWDGNKPRPPKPGPPHHPHGPKPPVKWWKTQQGFCYDKEERTYQGFRNTRPHHPLNCLVEAQDFADTYFPPGTQVRGYHVGFDVGPICDLLVDADVHPKGNWQSSGWMPVNLPGPDGSGPVDSHIQPPTYGAHVTCLPAPKDCDAEVKFCSDQHHTLVGKIPDTCGFLACPSTPPPEPTPSACQCQKDLQNPSEDWDSMSFYCAKLTRDPTKRACEPMSEIPTTGLPSSICQPGWLECPGRPTSLNPVDTGDRCGCNSYIDASPDESLLCVGPNTFQNGKMERVCKLPYSDGTCPSSYTVCQAPRVMSATLNASLHYYLEVSSPWSLQYFLKLQLAQAMQLNTTSFVKLYSICPASSCTSRGCPSTHEERLQAGCVWLSNDADPILTSGTVTGDKLILDFDVKNIPNESDRSRIIANFFGSYLNDTSPAFSKLKVSDMQLQPAPIMRTVPAPEHRFPIPIPLLVIGIILLVGGFIFGAIFMRNRGGHIPPVTSDLRQTLVTKDVELSEEVCRAIDLRQRQAYANLLQIQLDACTRRVEEWRTEQVSSLPSDRDPSLPLGESAGKGSDAPWWDAPSGADISGDDSSEEEVAI
eukprot:TRINITY_DN2124_c1_g1_i1.p1 TRINITY_DN2124_c1_g1~~TRINITY_DN2124_c1_g1_i1.p1  ORF type:complete len:646 (+),score=110.06 TRINITY_DN2124_c1_g1_i1:57-1994(+)